MQEFMFKLNRTTLAEISIACTFEAPTTAGYKTHLDWFRSIMARREKAIQKEEKRLGF